MTLLFTLSTFSEIASSIKAFKEVIKDFSCSAINFTKSSLLLAMAAAKRRTKANWSPPKVLAAAR
eukprot:7428734-Prorocentrum_lima.AAC.1